MTPNVLYYIALLLLSGLVFGKLAKKCKLPNVTGYLVGGLIIGPSIFRLIPANIVDQMGIISDMALGFIAFSIGSEFKMSYFKRVGFTPVIIALFEALVAVLFVTLGLIAVGCSVPFSIVLGSIAAATAPAATIMVVKQYKAKGPVTEMLMSVVALDDAVALISFGFAVAVANAMTSGGAVNLLASILSPCIEIFGGLFLGAIMGVLLTFPIKWFTSASNRLGVIICFVFAASGLAAMFGFSPLLTCMALGGIFVNLSSNSNDIMKISDSFTPPLFMLFFVVSGASLNISVIPTIGAAGIVYVVLRVIGKIAGAWFGAKITKTSKAVQKFLGPTLLPQAGVAIGLSLVAQSVVPDHAQAIRAVVLCATLIYELVGPVISKITLEKAGEIHIDRQIKKA